MWFSRPGITGYCKQAYDAHSVLATLWMMSPSVTTWWPTGIFSRTACSVLPRTDSSGIDRGRRAKRQRETRINRTWRPAIGHDMTTTSTSIHPLHPLCMWQTTDLSPHHTTVQDFPVIDYSTLYFRNKIRFFLFWPLYVVSITKG